MDSVDTTSTRKRDITLFEESELADDSIPIFFDDSLTMTEDKTFQGHSKTITAICLVGEGMLASGSKDKTVRLWDIERVECIRTFEGHNLPVTSLCTFCGYLASASFDKTIRIWNMNTGLSTVFTGHLDPVLSVCSVGKLLASSSEDHTIRLWNEKGKCLETLTGHTTPVCICALNDTKLVSTWGFDARVWDVTNGDLVQNLDGGGGWVLSVCVVNNQVITAAKTIRVWDWETGTLIRTLNGHDNRVYTVCALDGGLMASSGSNEIHVWDPKSGEILTSFEEKNKSLCPSKVLCPMSAGYFASASDSREFDVRNVFLNCPVEVLMKLSDFTGGVEWSGLCTQARELHKPLHLNYILTQMGHSITIINNYCFFGQKYNEGEKWYVVMRMLGDLIYVATYGSSIDQVAESQVVAKTEHALVFRQAFGMWANENDMNVTFAFTIHEDDTIEWTSPSFNVIDITPEEVFRFRVKRSKFWTEEFTDQSIQVLSDDMKLQMHAREIGLRRLGFDSMETSVPYGFRGKCIEVIQTWKSL